MYRRPLRVSPRSWMRMTWGDENLARGRRLAPEALDAAGAVVAPGRRHHLERDRLAQDLVGRQVDRAHAAAADEPLDEVALVEHLAGGQLAFDRGPVGGGARAALHQGRGRADPGDLRCGGGPATGGGRHRDHRVVRQVRGRRHRRQRPTLVGQTGEPKVELVVDAAHDRLEVLDAGLQLLALLTQAFELAGHLGAGADPLAIVVVALDRVSEEWAAEEQQHRCQSNEIVHTRSLCTAAFVFGNT